MRRFMRIQGRKSLNYSSIITIVVVISACIIGTWITIASLVSSVKNFDKSVKFIKDIKLQNARKEFSKDLPANALKLNVDNTLQKFEKSGEWDQVEMLEKASADDNNRIDSNKGKEVKFTVDGDAKHLEHDPVTNTGRDERTPMDQQESEESIAAIKPKKDDGEEKPWVEENSDSTKEEIDNIKVEVNIQKLEQFSVSLEQNKDAGEKTTDSWSKDQSKLLNGTFDEIVVQAAESEKQKVAEEFSLLKDQKGFIWKLCNVTAGPDYIPCLDNIQAIRKLPNISHYEHRERHCPDEAPTCLVPLPEGYRTSVQWPKSREKIWFANVPHLKLIEFKGHQNWVQVSGSYITFPGGGTQFKHGAMHYIDFIQKTVPDISWGKRSRIVLDVGCGVASFGGYLFDREVLTMSLAPKDKHEAQVQFALERGIPAISGVMGTQRLPFPIMAFDVVHCARCRVPWHIEGGKLLLELDRVLRPGGYFVWSATPIYRKDPEDVSIWKAMSKLTKSMCWELLRTGNDKLNGVSVAIYRKPTSNDCYESRTKNDPPLCQESDKPSAVWNVPLEACIHKVPKNPSVRGYQLPAKWPSRLEKPPYWLKDSETGDYGKAAPKDFMDDYEHWKRVFVRSYSNGIGIDWSSVRNVMDMKAMYGGFAAALKDLKLWVMNVVPITSPDTLSIIYERGLFGIYHDWCESFSTYPRSYDLLHADHLFSDLKKRCKFVAVIAEVDRILRPGGSLIVKDDVETITEVENLAKSLKWKINFIFSNDNEGVLCVQKTRWRPSDAVTIISAVA